MLRPVLIALVCSLTPMAQAQVTAVERLRLIETIPSPWGAPLGPAYAKGSPLNLAPKAFAGPGPLRCAGGTYQFVRSPAEGLFEGNLPAPADHNAAALGLPKGIVTQRVSCANGGFDLHRAADGRAWIGLDNAVLKFERVELETSPEASVQSLLIHHFSSGLSTSADTLDAQRAWLSDTLIAQFNGWLARNAKRDEPPELNGDPFTDSQEPPDTFTLAPSRIQGERADVAVTFSDEHTKPYVVTFSLQRAHDGWRVDDIRYRHGALLSTLLKQ